MTASKKNAPKQAVVIKAPKIVTAWTSLCKQSAKSEKEVVTAIENLFEVLITESRLTVADQKKFIKGLEEQNLVSSFIKSSHVPALATWKNLRKLHKDFTALPIAKQLSTAMASYDILGVGKGELHKSVESLTKEVATVRKAKSSARKAQGSTPKASAKGKASNADTLASILTYFSSLVVETLEESEKDTIAEIHAVIESQMASA